MSIIAFTGLPGSGKSYGIVENVIVPALKDSRLVVTNIPLKLEEIRKEYPASRVEIISDLSEYVNGEKFFELEAGCVLVLDEAWRLWRSGMRANAAPVKALEFFAEHRHMVGPTGKTTEIVLCCQDLSQVASFCRQLVEKTYISRKLSAAGVNSAYRVDIYMGMVTGQKGPDKMHTGVIHGKYKPEIYRFYQSHTKGGGVVGNEQIADTRGTIWQHPLIRYGMPVCIIAAIFCFYKGADFFTGMAERKADRAMSAQAAAKKAGGQPLRQSFDVGKGALPLGFEDSQLVAASTVDSRTVIKDSKRWRIVGSILKADGTGYAVLRDWDGNMRTIDQTFCNHLDKAMDGSCDDGTEIITPFTGVRQSILPALVQSKPR